MLLHPFLSRLGAGEILASLPAGAARNYDASSLVLASTFGFALGIDSFSSRQVVVDLIGATTTRTGLTVHAELDEGNYPKGIKVTDDEMATVGLERHDFHGDWNYTIRPPRSSRTTAA